MIETIINKVIVYLDKLKFSNPKLYVGIVCALGLAYLAQIILPTVGVNVPENLVWLEHTMNAITVIFLGVANPKTNRYLIEKGLKDKSNYIIVEEK